MSDYQPIDCSVHDRIEDAAVRRRQMKIVFERDGERSDIVDVPVDWFTHEGAEFMRTAGGLVIRLDRLVSIEET